MTASVRFVAFSALSSCNLAGGWRERSEPTNVEQIVHYFLECCSFATNQTAIAYFFESRYVRTKV